MAFGKRHTFIDLNDLHRSVKDSDIAYHYFGVTHIPCLINSPIRKDTKPSLGLYSRDGKYIFWTDFATKEKGSILQLLQRIWNCSFTKVLERVNRELSDKSPDVLISPSIKNKTIVEKLRPSNVNLECKIREWQQYDIDYWQSYGIPLPWLKYAEIYPISHKIVIKDNKRYVFGCDKYAYAFIEHKEDKITIKVYQPFNKRGFKWSNKHDKSVLSLWTKIPAKGHIVTICSSLKDALCLWVNTGIPAIAVQGEGYSISEAAINVLKKRFKNICVCFDNDEPGKKDAVKFSQETGFVNITLPPFEGGKDISDYYKVLNNKELFKTEITNLFKKELK